MESINSNIEKKDKVREYSLLRVLLMLLVVLGHSTYLIIQTTYGGVHYIMNEPNNFILHGHLLSICLHFLCCQEQYTFYQKRKQLMN